MYRVRIINIVGTVRLLAMCSVLPFWSQVPLTHRHGYLSHCPAPVAPSTHSSHQRPECVCVCVMWGVYHSYFRMVNILYLEHHLTIRTAKLLMVNRFYVTILYETK